ncbi:MAG: OB-fold nucleic acid binding domain-containing protein, partial [Candidatus Marinimicrobia bacterium]|nr:OB-fold nucleic acid binding domain-containing protein [Candidatus Neomarinimicrobiota bacterium]
MSAEKQALPGHEQQPQEMLCPSCGRYVGGAGRCRYCGARSRKRLSLVVTRWAAVFLATVGLYLLYLMAINRDIEQVWVGEITPMMNFAYVRIAGVVDSEPRIFQRSGRVEGLRFDVDDGTGTLSVSAYRQQAEEIVAAGQVPRSGDQVEVVGSLSVSADDRTLLRLQSLEGLRIVRAETPAARIADLRPDHEGPVQISGEITDVRAPPPDSRAPWTIRIRDASGEAPVSFWQDV